MMEVSLNVLLIFDTMYEKISVLLYSENWRFHFWKNNVVEKLRFCQGPCLVQILRLPLDF